MCARDGWPRAARHNSLFVPFFRLSRSRFDDGQFPLHTKLAQMKRADQLGDPSQYAAIFFAGGHGCCADFPTAQNLQQLAARIYESGGVVGAVCHGIAIFDGLRLSSGEKLIAGRQATGFSQKGEEGMKLMDWMRKNSETTQAAGTCSGGTTASRHGSTPLRGPHSALLFVPPVVCPPVLSRCPDYSTMESIVRRNGGDWSEASNPMSEYTRTSGRVITGMNPASAKAVAQEVIKTITPDKGDKAATASASSSAVKGVSTDSTVDKQSKAYSGERTTAV